MTLGIVVYAQKQNDKSIKEGNFMNKLVYKELMIAVIAFEENDIIATSGDGENFGSTMPGWRDLTGGGNS